MHLDGFIVLAGAIVGFAVGLTGMGGGALMTPVLVLLLHVQPGAAVSSDLVASFFMKPVGGAVHLRRHTVHLRLAAWLVVGAAPAAFAGAALLHAVASGKALQNDIKLGLGAALLLAVAGIVLRSVTAKRAVSTVDDDEPAWPPVRRLATLAVGVVGGLIVGMTSVGSGSLMIVALMFLYPRLSGRQLVGTDLVQSVPLVGAAALGQLLFGSVSFGVTTSLLLGSLPAVYLGARLSSVAPTRFTRPAIAVVLVGSAVKLVGGSNALLLVSVFVAAALALAPAAVRRARGRGRRTFEPAPSAELATGELVG
ncbi:MAG: sulfite exporter TauE/SafE family protein [Acidimicrobiales bacterium]